MRRGTTIIHITEYLRIPLRAQNLTLKKERKKEKLMRQFRIRKQQAG